MEETNATPSDGGASILDRIQAHLDAPEAPQTQATPDVAASADTEVEPIADGAEQDNGPQITTSDLAKILGVDEGDLDLDEDGSPKFKTKIDGAEGAAKLRDLLKSYQLEGHVNKRSMEVAEREKALQARAQEVEQQAQARLQQVEQLNQVAAQELMREYQSIDWNTLRLTDPGNYAALRADFQERSAKLQAVSQHVQREAQQRAQAAESQRVQFMQQQAQRLPELIPEWKDASVAEKERTELRTWAVKQGGFDPREVDNLTNAHHVAVMRKAMLYDKLQQSKPAIENKVRTAPKLVKPGQAVEDGKTQNLRNLKQQIVKSGGRKGITDWLIATGKV